MEKAGNPEKIPKLGNPDPMEIPIAQREPSKASLKPRSRPKPLAVALAVLGGVALMAGGVFALRFQQTPPTPVATNSSDAPSSPAPTTAANKEMLLNHYAYSEAPRSELEAITSDGSLKLRKAAAQAFKNMVSDAQQEGVSLVPISGFRSLDDQKYLYFSIKAERGQNSAERAKVSAPPGYSEHHTGYAIDLGDGNVPAVNLSQSFEQTAAFKWLQANAAFHSFEISFPQGNRQGVSYEPWHWRYVGDIDSLKTFYKARSSK